MCGSSLARRSKWSFNGRCRWMETGYRDRRLQDWSARTFSREEKDQFRIDLGTAQTPKDR
jgi:hypothetical protein